MTFSLWQPFDINQVGLLVRLIGIQVWCLVVKIGTELQLNFKPFNSHMEAQRKIQIKMESNYFFDDDMKNKPKQFIQWTGMVWKSDLTKYSNSVQIVAL